MVLLKWLQFVTKGLFATSERPIFLLFDENCHEPSNVISNCIAVLGGEVVCLCKASPSHRIPDRNRADAPSNPAIRPVP